jgi:hypothetical protein
MAGGNSLRSTRRAEGAREAATAFKELLEGVVWQSKDLSPGLDGAPTARVLDDVDPTRLQ